VKITFPTGTVTFLFTDIQGSTPLWERAPEKMAEALQVHNSTLRGAIEANGGVVFKTVGDAFQAAFPTALGGLKAAIDGQKALQSASWNELGELKVRMGLHTGEAELDPNSDEYSVSHTKNRVARIHSVAYGGQILISLETADLVNHNLPDGVTLKDLGEHRLKGMEWLERLFQVNAPEIPQDFPALETSSAHPNNLPVQLTSFIGREKEIADIVELLSEHRLVTLTGSGGVGKTRLSVQAVGEMLVEFPYGIWLVDLTPLSDPDLVPQAVATVLGLREEPNIPMLDTLGHFLSTRELLLVLDNCEHLLEACAELADALLRKTSLLKMLVTSREVLGIAGETVFRVPSLNFPDRSQAPALSEIVEYEAVQLFMERARLTFPTFEVSEHNSPAITAICQRLDGIPLAIELAAARLNMLTTEQLATRLDRAFQLLTRGNREALPRHQTLRATIDWSYQLLSEPEGKLLRRLSVFAGGGTLEAVEIICSGEGLERDQVLDLLSDLVNKSMVNADRKRQAETRYRLLETVRQYGLEKLHEAGEYKRFQDRHLDYYLALAENIEPQLRTSIAVEQLRVLYREVDNLRIALSWALDISENARIESGLRLASALLNFWHRQSFHLEGYAWLMKGLAPIPGIVTDPGVRAKACFSAGHLILPLGRISEARQWEQESLALYQKAGDARGVVTAQSMLGEVCAWGNSFDEAKEFGEATVAMCRDLNDDWLLAWVICRLGTSFFYQGADDLSAPLLEESLEIFERKGELLQVSDHLIMLGTINYNRGALSKAEAYYERALISAQSTQSNWNEGNILTRIGIIAYEKDEFQRMRDYMVQSAIIHQETGNYYQKNTENLLGIAEIHLNHLDQAKRHFLECLRMSTVPYDVAVSLIGFARIAVKNGQANLSARLLGACKETIEKGQSLQFGRIGINEYKLCWYETKMLMEETAFEQAVSLGRSMDLKQAVALTQEEPG
jgi:predicted ATPase/class 3 adenylate cyclase